MTPEYALDAVSKALHVTIVIAGPLLAAGMIVGIIIAILQAATQINESTLSFVPKLVVVIAVAAIAAPFIIRTLVDLLRDMVSRFPTAAM